ncbi:MAG: hypothetical protein IPH35_02900 [Rhodoferax sp.]|nr:hypothetical protein [Rhodoferax sp.]
MKARFSTLFKKSDSSRSDAKDESPVRLVVIAVDSGVALQGKICPAGGIMALATPTFGYLPENTCEQVR